ncbi:phosphatase PAP2 family protein [Geomonas sp. Red32]|uniref:phosphatase PAP2 family protein n=1 Tax=Geomonas sp. Red32 TaxID=2912856 RepID=UPI00202CA6D1|nr:phosphatase PAP2 family protein [Geomonas sp. Red32]MCM0082528.1 phosphatase PAP2 family protein [Geomonas sp. Red32]
MNFFDAGILHFLNGFAHHSWTFDFWVHWLTADDFQKGGPVALLLWWAWFLPSERQEENRQKLICVAFSAVAAVLVSRLSSEVLPFRARPLHLSALHLQLPYTVSVTELVHWNSFPSDHAALFYALVTGLFLVNRRIGIIAFLYVTLFISIPRMYLGFHYPTDIIAGGLLGGSVTWLACHPVVRGKLAPPILKLTASSPSLFYACCFFYTYQLACSFSWVNKTLSTTLHITSGVMTKLHL